MKHIYHIVAIVACLSICSCSTPRSSAYGISSRNIDTQVQSRNEYNLDILDLYITYTIDISTEEGRLRLNGLTPEEAAAVAERQAAIINKVDCIFDPKFDFYTKGKDVLRVTVAGRAANYKNSRYKQLPSKSDVIITK